MLLHQLSGACKPAFPTSQQQGKSDIFTAAEELLQFCFMQNSTSGPEDLLFHFIAGLFSSP